MHIKSLILGSAAVLATVTGATAADLPAAEPVEYVRVCDTFGTGYFCIPGTETCLRIGGNVLSPALCRAGPQGRP
ncbi:MAG: porin [Hyphomicrobiales bacterium]